MKFQWIKLFLVFLVVYYLVTISGDAMTKDGVLASFKQLTEFKYIYYEITGILVFYGYCFFSYASLFYFYSKKKIFLTIGGVLLGIILTISVRYILQEWLSRELFGFGNYVDDFPIDKYFISNLYYTFIFVGVGIAFFFLQRSQFEEKKRNELFLESKKAELDFLRSQVNPHFLFNSLNNIYALVTMKSDQSLKAISTLSELLRYALYETESTVPLSHEIKAIDDYIALENLRIKDGLKINKNFSEADQDIQVPPLLFIPFVENAIKHGIGDDPQKPIKIDIKTNSDQIILEVSNFTKVKNKDRIGGIGLENTTKRLKLLFPDKHNLKVSQQSDSFYVNLSIQR